MSDLGSQTRSTPSRRRSRSTAHDQRRAVRAACGFWRRFAATIVDGLILGHPRHHPRRAAGPGRREHPDLIGIAYYTYFEGGPTGQTIGKRALGIRVIDFKGGGPIGYPRGCCATSARILPRIPLFLGYFWMIWDKEKQIWQDKIANTVVVPIDAYPVNAD